MKKGNTGIGARIKSWRKGHNLRLRQLGELLDVSQGSLSDIENGNSDPSAQTIIEFKRNTDIDIIWMLTGEKEEGGHGESVFNTDRLVVNLNNKPGEILLKFK